MFRASRSRLEKYVVDLDDAAFQLLFALWAAADKGHDGWYPVVLPQAKMLLLPGSQESTRRGRSSIARTIRKLKKPEAPLLRLVRECVLPSAAGPGLAAKHQVIAPFAHDPASGAQLPELVRFARAVQRRMLDELHPRALRILVWLLATRRPDEPFKVSTAEIAKALRGKRDRDAPHLADLGTHGWLKIVEPSDGSLRRPGFYLLGGAFGGNAVE